MTTKHTDIQHNCCTFMHDVWERGRPVRTAPSPDPFPLLGHKVPQAHGLACTPYALAVTHDGVFMAACQKHTVRAARGRPCSQRLRYGRCYNSHYTILPWVEPARTPIRPIATFTAIRVAAIIPPASRTRNTGGPAREAVDMCTDSLKSHLPNRPLPSTRYSAKLTLCLLVALTMLGVVQPTTFGQQATPKPPPAAKDQGSPTVEGNPTPIARQLRGQTLPPQQGHRTRRAHPPHSRQYPQFVAGNAYTEQATPGVLVQGKWTNLYPYLNAVDAASNADGWAVGEYGHLLHYTGTTWVAVDPPVMRGLYLSDIDMTSVARGWIAAGPKAFRYDTNAWVDVSTGLGADISMHSVSATGDHNVWGVGYRTNPCCQPTIVRWDGSRWIAVTSPVPATATLSDISIVDTTTGWVVGYDDEGDAVTPITLRYEGAAWVQVPPPPDAGFLDYVWALSSTEAWIVGENAQGSSRIYRYSGGLWMSWPTPDNSVPRGIHMLSPTLGWVATSQSLLRWNGSAWSVEYTGRSLMDVVEAGGQVWAVGDADTVLARTGSGTWVLQRGGPTTNALYAVSVLDADNAWAVGSARTGTATIIHYTAGAWQVVTTTHPYSLWDVQMLSATEGYAVGDGGVLRWDGTMWTQASSSVPLNGLHMIASGEGWAVGPNGTIMRASGGTWALVSAPTNQDLLAVAMDSPTHGWAVGGDYPDGVVLLEYTGGRWVNRTTGLPPGSPVYLSDIWVAAGGRSGWIGGWRRPGMGQSALLRLSAGAWTVATGITASYVERLAPEALDEMMALGCEVYHYVGGSWQKQVMPTNSCQYDIGLVPGRGGWVVGPYGSIIRYNPLSPGQRFYDVPVGSAFYTYIECMAERGIVGGYADNTFRPAENITRGQLAKVVANSAGFNDPPGTQIFADVPPSHTFYSYIQRLANRGYMGGYPCGGPDEPCDVQRRPYFRPQHNATRGQVSKIVTNSFFPDCGQR